MEDEIPVELYVYDLSGGMAKSMSAALLGFQIDAIYHTSIVMGGTEYVYDGGLRQVQAGMTHLGRPIEKLSLGKTSLPIEVILEYLESLKPIYTAEAYDLWTHNCNNFSNDFATFLTGRGIPSHITNLPQTVLDSPFGRMLRPSIDNMIKNKRSRDEGLLGIKDGATARQVPGPQAVHQASSMVHQPTSQQQLKDLLQSAEKSCAVIFFTSHTCGPCKPLYPIFDELAAQAANKAVFIKIDISLTNAGAAFAVRATPTFVTFLNGQQENKWVGGNPNTLRGNVATLLQMAWPPHSHENLRLPTLRGSTTRPVLYTKVPPLDKLLLKMGESASAPAVLGLKRFIAEKSAEGAAESTLPDLNALTTFVQSSIQQLPVENMFAFVDLIRVAMSDPRFSGYYAEESDHKTIASIFDYVNKRKDCPYSLRLVALQLACNLFSSPLYVPHVLGSRSLTEPIVELITTSLLDETHHNVRVAAASLSFNIAASNNTVRREENREALSDGDQVELAASLLEAIGAEEKSQEALHGFLLALGYLIFCAPQDGELADMLKSMDAQGTVLGRGKIFEKEPLVPEIGRELLGKGLANK